MWVDIVAGLVVAASALTGAWRGTISALLRMGALVLCFLVARALGPQLASPFGGPDEVTPSIAIAQASFLTFLVVYTVAAGLLSNLFGRLYDGAKDSASGADRIVGGLLSAVRAAAFVIVLVSGLIYSNRFIASHWPALWVDYDASHVGRRVREYNVFLPEAFPRQWAFERLAQETRDGTWRQAARSVPALHRVMARPEASALFDGQVLRDIENADVHSLLSDPRVRELLSNPDVRRDLDLLSTGAVLRRGPLPEIEAAPPVSSGSTRPRKDSARQRAPGKAAPSASLR